RGAAGDLPHRPGGAHQRPQARRAEVGRAPPRLRGGRHPSHRGGPRRPRLPKRQRRRPPRRRRCRLRGERDARARRAARRPPRGGADRGRLPGRALAARSGARMSEPVRVLLADDQRVVREGLTLILDLLEDVEVVETASDGEQAVALAEQLAPDVVLMDLRMPRVDGIEATRRLTASRPRIGVIALTTYADDASVLGALRAGARGYLTKDASAEQIAAAIARVARGEASLDEAIQTKVVEAVTAGAHAEPAPSEGERAELPDDLTAREAEVLGLIAGGLSNQEIAERLVVSPATVKSHVNHLFAKIGARD